LLVFEKQVRNVTENKKKIPKKHLLKAVTPSVIIFIWGAKE
jgi:hypothetical protein